MRLFIAVDCPIRIKEFLSQFLKNSFQFLPQKGIKWVHPNNFHLTLRFLGEVEESRVELLHTTLRESTIGFQSFSSKFTTLGFFPNSAKPKVFWIGLDDPEKKIANLAKTIEQGLVANGFGKCDKEFSAHCTLARFASPPLLRVLQQIEKIKVPPLAELKITQLLLMQSILLPEGPKYEVIARFPFLR